MPPLFWYRYWRYVFTLTGSSAAFNNMIRHVRLDSPWPDRFTYLTATEEDLEIDLGALLSQGVVDTMTRGLIA